MLTVKSKKRNLTNRNSRNSKEGLCRTYLQAKFE